MSVSTRQHTIVTSQGPLAVEESSQGSIPVHLIHGNSSCRGVFRHQLQGRLAENHRLIAFDLPGHGHSSNAPDPTRSYTRPGLSDAAAAKLCFLSQPAMSRSLERIRDTFGDELLIRTGHIYERTVRGEWLLRELGTPKPMNRLG
jgi:pimeloyl-ACP methyl ester carboxylesterase